MRRGREYEARITARVHNNNSNSSSGRRRRQRRARLDRNDETTDSSIFFVAPIDKVISRRPRSFLLRRFLTVPLSLSLSLYTVFRETAFLFPRPLFFLLSLVKKFRRTKFTFGFVLAKAKREKDERDEKQVEIDR